MARPTKYKQKYCPLLYEHLAKGYSFATFAAVVGVNRDTLYNWVRKYPEFSDTKERGWTAAYYYWEKLGRENLFNRRFNTRIWLLTMRNRFGYR